MTGAIAAVPVSLEIVMPLRSSLLFALGALSISACEGGGAETSEASDMDRFAASGKTDTGYIKRADASKSDPDGGHEPEVCGVSGVATNIWKP